MTKLLDAVAKRPLESRRRRELGPEPQQFPRRRVGVVEHQEAIAESVGEALGVPTRERFLSAVYSGDSVDDEVGGDRHEAHISGSRLSPDMAGQRSGSTVHGSYVADRDSVAARRCARACERCVLGRQDVLPFCTIDRTSQGIPKKSP